MEERFRELLLRQPEQLSLIEKVARVLKLSAMSIRTEIKRSGEEFDPGWALYVTGVCLFLIERYSPQLYDHLAELSLTQLQHSILEEMLIIALANYHPLSAVRRNNFNKRLMDYTAVQIAAAEALVEGARQQ